MRKTTFIAVLHSGDLGMTFQPHRDVVSFYGTVSVGKLRDLYRDSLIRSGVVAGEAIARASTIRGAFIFTDEVYSGLGFNTAPASEEDNNKRLLSACSLSRFQSGCFDPGVKLKDEPVRTRATKPLLNADEVSTAIETQLGKQRGRK